jgi:transcriptional regulator GlxA family with amidase domain
VGFVLSRSFTLSAFALFVDTLRLASDEQDRSGRVLADWQVIGSTRHLITSSCGVQVAPTSDFVDPSRFDYIVVVGGLLTVENPVDQQTIAFLKQADAKKVPLIGVCTGSFILAAAGLMKRHESCVSWLHYKEFRERFPDLSVRSDRLFNLDRQRGSCAGGSSAADIQPRRPLYDDYDDTRVKAAMITMEQFVDGSMPIEKLAAMVGLSRRQLERIFIDKTGMSPAKAYNRVRMERAKSILAQSKAPLIEIALDVGFENASQFTRTFKRTFGQTPSQHRAASRAH